MSKLNIFIVKDMKARLYLHPTVQRSIPDAMRTWEIAANDEQSMMSKFPHDYRLFHLGEIDDETGELRPLAQPADLGSAADMKRPPSSQLPFDIRRDEKL